MHPNARRWDNLWNLLLNASSHIAKQAGGEPQRVMSMAKEAGGELAAAEARVLAHAGVGGTAVDTHRLRLPGGDMEINYLVVGGEGAESSATTRPACVLVHGFGCGVGSWAANISALAAHGYTVYAVDLVGFGLSSRPDFSPAVAAGGSTSSRAEAAEHYFVHPLEQWRDTLCRSGHRALETPTWIGHSLGGFVVCCYALRFPARVQSLILVDPWGLQDATEEDEGRIPLPLRSLISALPSPLSPIRWLDSLGGLGKSAFYRAKSVEHTRWIRSVRTAACTAPEANSPDQQGIHADPAHRNKKLDAAAPCREPSRHWQWCVNLVRSLAQGNVRGNDMTDYLYCLATVPDCGGDHAFKVEETTPRVREILPCETLTVLTLLDCQKMS